MLEEFLNTILIRDAIIPDCLSSALSIKSYGKQDLVYIHNGRFYGKDVRVINLLDKNGF